MCIWQCFSLKFSLFQPFDMVVVCQTVIMCRFFMSEKYPKEGIVGREYVS